jgi:hypothetical protein
MALSKIDVANMLTGIVPNDNTIRRPNAKPLIINGDMAVAQRGTSTTSITSAGYYTCDRFKLNRDGIGTWTVIQESLTSGEAYNNGFRKAFRMDCTSATASPSADNNLSVIVRVEGQDLQLFKKGTSNAEKFTLAFWVKSNKTGTSQVNLRDNDNTRLISATYAISSANTWEHKVLNFAADTTGAFDNDNALSLQIEWFLDSGTDFSSGTAPTAWEASDNTDRNANNLALGNSTDNDWAITGVQLEVGEYTSSTLPPFQHESFGDNLARCQRYFQMIAEGNQKIISMAHWGSSTEVDFVVEVPTTMRARPTLDYTTGNEYWAIGGSGGSTNTLDNLNVNSWSTDSNINLWSTTGAGGTAGFAYYGYTNNASAKLGFTSEL